MAAPAVLPKVLVVDIIAVSPGSVLYVTPATSTVARVGLIVVTNPDTSPHTFSIRSSLGAMTVDDAHCLVKDVAIGSGDTIVYTYPRVLGDGTTLGRLHFEADTGSVLWAYVTGSEIDTLHPDVGRSIPKQTGQFLLTTSPQALIGSVGGLSQVLMSLNLCNVDASPHVVQITYDLFPVTIYQDITVPANDTLVLTDLLIADDAAPGDGVLSMTADANSFVAATVSVVDVTIT